MATTHTTNLLPPINMAHATLILCRGAVVLTCIIVRFLRPRCILFTSYNAQTSKACSWTQCGHLDPALTPTNIVLYSYCYDLITSISQNNCRVSNKSSRLYFRGEVLIPRFPSSPRSHWSLHLPSSHQPLACGFPSATSQCKPFIGVLAFRNLSHIPPPQLSESYRKQGQKRLWCKLCPSSKFNWIWQEIEYTQSKYTTLSEIVYNIKQDFKKWIRSEAVRCWSKDVFPFQSPVCSPDNVTVARTNAWIKNEVLIINK